MTAGEGGDNGGGSGGGACFDSALVNCEALEPVRTRKKGGEREREGCSLSNRDCRLSEIVWSFIPFVSFFLGEYFLSQNELPSARTASDLHVLHKEIQRKNCYLQYKIYFI